MKKWLILPIFLILTACGGGPNSGGNAPTAGTPGGTLPSTSGDPKEVVAELDGQPITAADLNAVTGSQLARIQAQIYDIQKQGLDSMIQERLVKKEAAKRGISVQELTKVEILDKVGEVSDKEVEDFYNQNKPRFGGKTLEEVKTPLKQQLFARKASVYQQQFIDKLEENANIKINLVRPTINVSVDDDPMKGNKDAKVTIVEFTDYQCPFCGQARPVIKQLIQEYGDKIHYVLRDFPLDFHPFAKKAAEGAECAGDQGKYWEYSDVLWANQGSLDTTSLKKYAAELKLDQKKFDDCLNNGKFSAEVSKDLQDGSNAGVSGTPSFFINGQMITGARPIEQFKEMIDEELKTSKK